MKQRILITGSRDWTDDNAIFRALLNRTLTQNLCPYEIVVVHGGCPTGADKIANDIAIEEGYQIEIFPARWSMFGRKAGILRNEDMVYSNPDVCFAFIKNSSPGATHCAMLAEKRGINTYITYEDD